MVAPLIGAGLRMGAKKLAQKFGKKDEKKTSINLIEEAQKKEAEGKRRAQIESVKEGVKTAAKTTAKATGAAGGAGVMYLTAEDRLLLDKVALRSMLYVRLARKVKKKRNQ